MGKKKRRSRSNSTLAEAEQREAGDSGCDGTNHPAVDRRRGLLSHEVAERLSIPVSGVFALDAAKHAAWAVAATGHLHIFVLDLDHGLEGVLDNDSADVCVRRATALPVVPQANGVFCFVSDLMRADVLRHQRKRGG